MAALTELQKTNYVLGTFMLVIALSAIAQIIYYLIIKCVIYVQWNLTFSKQTTKIKANDFTICYCVFSRYCSSSIQFPSKYTPINRQVLILNRHCLQEADALYARYDENNDIGFASRDYFPSDVLATSVHVDGDLDTSPHLEKRSKESLLVGLPYWMRNHSDLFDHHYSLFYESNLHLCSNCQTRFTFHIYIYQSILEYNYIVTFICVIMGSAVIFGFLVYRVFREITIKPGESTHRKRQSFLKLVIIASLSLIVKAVYLGTMSLGTYRSFFVS